MQLPQHVRNVRIVSRRRLTGAASTLSAALLLLVGGAGCRDRAPASGPGFATRVQLQLQLRPAPQAAAPLAPRGPDFTLDAARVTVVSLPGSSSTAGPELANQVVRFSGADAVTVELAVPLASAEERVLVRVAATDVAAPGDTLFRGDQAVTVTRADAGLGGRGGGAEPVEVPLSYSGPDLAVARIELAPADTILTVGDSVRVRAVARRADGSALPGARIRLSVDDNAATLTSAGWLKAGGSPFAGVWVYAGTANGVVDSVRISARQPGGAPATWAAIAAGFNHSCALDAGGAAYCWGENDYGQLGDGTTVSRSSPTRVATQLVFASLSLGRAHSCALTSAGLAYCWGANDYGQLGDGTDTYRGEPTAVTADFAFQWLDAGDAHTCGVRLAAAGQPGTLYCWGFNGSGRLGDGTVTERQVPTPVASQTLFFTVSAGGSHSCATGPEGSAFCWGYNGDGQVGDGTYGQQQGGVADRLVPTQVVAQVAFREVYAGAFHSCGLASSGAAYCWGDNNVWQVGAGSPPQDVVLPTAVLGEHLFTALRVGGGHNCGIKSDGELWCWGFNGDGRMGDGTTQWRLTPVQVGGALRFPVAALGDGHACGLEATGVGYCWGRNQLGQVGDGTTTQRLLPVPVAPDPGGN